jgi:hypothetical protein
MEHDNTKPERRERTDGNFPLYGNPWIWQTSGVMDFTDSKLTTGMPGLDKVLKGLIPGDNVVWQIEDIEDYIELVKPYAEAAHRSGRKLISSM